MKRESIPMKTRTEGGRESPSDKKKEAKKTRGMEDTGEKEKGEGKGRKF